MDFCCAGDTAASWRYFFLHTSLPPSLTALSIYSYACIPALLFSPYLHPPFMPPPHCIVIGVVGLRLVVGICLLFFSPSPLPLSSRRYHAGSCACLILFLLLYSLTPCYSLPSYSCNSFMPCLAWLCPTHYAFKRLYHSLYGISPLCVYVLVSEQHFCIFRDHCFSRQETEKHPMTLPASSLCAWHACALPCALAL